MSHSLDRLTIVFRSRYAIRRDLGTGGMATAYLAEDIEHDRPVVIKVLRPILTTKVGAARFLREIDAAAGLTHPHILPLLGSGRDDDVVYYVMPYIEGRSLREKLARERTLSIELTVSILYDVADALVEAHGKGVVHSGIKPENIMLDHDHVYVTDFAVGKALRAAAADGQLTTIGMIVGTPVYLAPEQAAGDPNIDHRADIYALGVVAYEMLRGQPPFVRDTVQEVLAAHVTETPTILADSVAGLPAALTDLVMKCLRKTPAERWQTAEELLSQLQRIG